MVTISRPVKCPVCGLFFNREQIAFVHHKNRYYHKTCYDRQVQQSVQDEKDLKSLEEYVVRLLGLDCINARVRKQIKDMREAYNFTYSGIQKSLEYFYEIKGNSIAKANGGIGIVPYVYEDAKVYFYTIYMTQLQNEGKNASEYVTKGRTITISPPQRNIKPKIKEFDLSILEEEILDEEE